MTRPRTRIAALLLALGPIAIATAGCGRDDGPDEAHAHAAAPIGDNEDAVCGMIVREQSAPRAQALHRDGERLFFCSLGDWLVHLAAPSPHGNVVATFVEVMAEHEDPLETHTDPHPWHEAEAASYVVGVERRGIMGEPVLAYADRATAERVAARHAGARVLDLAALRSWWRAREAER